MSPIQKKSSTSVMSIGNERCPSCDRHFGPKAYDRHVEWCKEKKSRIQQSPPNVLLAKERLEARIKYKVPPLNKPKKLTTKEKYASNNAIRPEITSPNNVYNTKSTGSIRLDRTPSIRKPKSIANLTKSTKENPKQEKIDNIKKDSERNAPKDNKKSVEEHAKK